MRIGKSLIEMLVVGGIAAGGVGGRGRRRQIDLAMISTPSVKDMGGEYAGAY